MGDAIHQYAFTEDKRTGEYLLWADTAASLKRLGIGLVVSAVIALVFGIATGSIPLVTRDALAVHHGDLDDPAARGAADPLHRVRARRIVEGRADRHRHHADDHPRSAQRAREIPRELWVKAQTLGADAGR